MRRRCRCFECPSRAQEPGRIYRLGILTGAARQAPRMVAFLDELKVLGFVEGQNVKIVAAGFDLRENQYADVAATLAKAAPDVVLGVGDAAIRAAQQSAYTGPIVALSGDLVAAGFVRFWPVPVAICPASARSSPGGAQPRSAAMAKVPTQ